MHGVLEPGAGNIRSDAIGEAVAPRFTCRIPWELIMSLLLKALALKLVAGRTLGGMFALLTMLLVPVAAVLKFVGLPLLAVLGVIGAPLFLVLGAIGLPVLFVVGIGAALMLLLGVVLMLGVVAVKIVLPIVLVVWFVRWLRRPHPPANFHPDGAAPGGAR